MSVEGKDERGLFMPGNKFWDAKLNTGKPRIFATPDDLWTACVGYFDWADANPLWEVKVFGSGESAGLPRMRAMTQRGLCVHLKIGLRTWRDYRGRAEYTDTCERVEDIIYEQKFTGAAAGIFSAVIIARDLGLVDQSVLTVPDGINVELKPSQKLEGVLNGIAKRGGEVGESS